MYIVGKLLFHYFLKLLPSSGPSSGPSPKLSTVRHNMTPEEMNALEKMIDDLYIAEGRLRDFSVFVSLDPEYFHEQKRLIDKKIKWARSDIQQRLHGEALKHYISESDLHRFESQVQDIKTRMANIKNVKIDGERTLRRILCHVKPEEKLDVYLQYNEFKKQWYQLDPTVAFLRVSEKNISHTFTPATRNTFLHYNYGGSTAAECAALQGSHQVMRIQSF